jgi:hypothetical protein
MRAFSNIQGFQRLGFIKSIQRGTINLSGVTSKVATINSVDLAHTFLISTGSSTDSIGNNVSFYRMAFTSNTQITATRFTTGGTLVNISYLAVEYFPGLIKSIQTGVINNNTTATIQYVDLNKTFLFHLGSSCNLSADQRSEGRLTFDNETTLRQTVVLGSGETTTTSYAIVQFH